MFEFFAKWTSYDWFFYLGILFFITHYYVNQSHYLIDMSYFGLLLIFIGWKKPALYGWVIWVLWIFVILNILSDIFMLQTRFNTEELKESGESKKTFTEEDANKYMMKSCKRQYKF